MSPSTLSFLRRSPRASVVRAGVQAFLPRALSLGLGLAPCACGSEGGAPSALPAAGAAGAAGAPSGGASNAGSGNAGAPAAGTSGGGGGGAGGSPAAGECNVRVVESPPTSAEHVTTCSELSYSTNPPSGGDHYAAWAAFQTYDVAVPAGFLVHDLEHGAVVFWYDCPEGCADEVADVEAFIGGLPEDPLCEPFSTPRRTVLVPYPELASRWAASAWGFALTADCFDAAAFEAFYLEHVGRGPEDLCSPNSADVETLCP